MACLSDRRPDAPRRAGDDDSKTIEATSGRGSAFGHHVISIV